MENVTLEPELEEALASATDAELCDIAGNKFPLLVDWIYSSTLYLFSLTPLIKRQFSKCY